MIESPSRKKKLLTRVAALVVICATLFIFLRYSEGMKAKKADDTVTIAFSSIPLTALAQVAQTQGFFEQEGIRVVPLTFPYGKLALRAMLDGKADLATVAETPVVLAVLGGERLSIISTIHSSSRSHAIVARRDRGILSPADLKGKRIAVPFTTSAHFFLDLFLLSHGIASGEVALIDMAPDAMPDALARGRVDAFAVFDPFVTVGRRKLGAGAVVFYDEDIYTETFNVVAGERFAARNPEKVRKILKGLLRAEAFVRNNPEQAQRDVAAFSHTDLEVVRTSWQGGDFRVRLDQSLILALEDESRWALRRGLAAGKVPNYLDYVYFHGLETVKPQAVRILR